MRITAKATLKRDLETVLSDQHHRDQCRCDDSLLECSVRDPGYRKCFGNTMVVSKG